MSICVLFVFGGENQLLKSSSILLVYWGRNIAQSHKNCINKITMQVFRETWLNSCGEFEWRGIETIINIRSGKKMAISCIANENLQPMRSALLIQSFLRFRSSVNSIPSKIKCKIIVRVIVEGVLLSNYCMTFDDANDGSTYFQNYSAFVRIWTRVEYADALLYHIPKKNHSDGALVCFWGGFVWTEYVVFMQHSLWEPLVCALILHAVELMTPHHNFISILCCCFPPTHFMRY